MATYAVQFLTSDGALCGQVIMNRARAVQRIEAWMPQASEYAVAILIVGSSFKERSQLGDFAVSDVLYHRRDALRFLNVLADEEQT